MSSWSSDAQVLLALMVDAVEAPVSYFVHRIFLPIVSMHSTERRRRAKNGGRGTGDGRHQLRYQQNRIRRLRRFELVMNGK